MAGCFGEKKVQCFCWESQDGRPARINAKHKNGFILGFEAAQCGGCCCCLHDYISGTVRTVRTVKDIGQVVRVWGG